MAKRKARKKKQQFDLNRNLFEVLFSIIGAVLLVVALFVEFGVQLTAAGLSSLATAATVYAVRKRRENAQKRKVVMPKAPPKAPTRLRAKPAPEPAEETAGSGGVVKCTNTGKPIEGDGRCTCATRHVATQAGVKTFGGPIGRPIGKKAKEPRVPTTSRAKPIPAGYAMQKD